MHQESFTLDHWTEKDYRHLVRLLEQKAEEEYRQFSARLIPGGEPILGVRMPALRALGKQISQGAWREYLTLCKTDTFEEIVLKGIVIGLAPACLEELRDLTDGYVPLITNWAACDYFWCGLKRVKKYREDFLPKIQEYLVSENPWAKRTGLVLLRSHYVTEAHAEKIPLWAERSICGHYYVQMAHAWLLAECYTKFPQQTYRYLQNCRLEADILNKMVQKIRDSNRVSEEWKEKATAFRRKL